MAHKVIAADLGAASIKLARFESTFRTATFLDARVIPCRTTGTPEERIPQQMAVLAQSMITDRYLAEEVALGLPGEVLAFRVLDLPFANPRQIESVLTYELETLVLAPVEDLVVDFLIIGPRPSGETRILAAAAPRSLVSLVVKTATELKLPLRTLCAAPLAYAAMMGQGEAANWPGPTMVVDLGIESTTVCVLRDGKPEMARAIGRGGRHVRDAVGANFRLTEEEAERAVRESGFIGHAEMQPSTPGQQRMDACIREVLRPLIRELRQTHAAYRAAYGDPVDRLWLCGGGARLVGIQEHLAQELGVVTGPFPWPDREGWPDSKQLEGNDAELPVAVGLAVAAAGDAPQANFRKGEFAYRSDYSFIRTKARHIVVAMFAVLCFGSLNTWASLRGLRKEHELLTARLKKATIEVFGQEKTDLHAISDELKNGPKGFGQLPIPTTTAFDLLDEISRSVPPPDKVKLDVTELDLRPKKTAVKATAETAQQVDDIADGLSKVECFEDVSKGRLVNQTRNVTMPATPEQERPETKQVEVKEFTLTIKSTCP
jgi:general secretion pathway protein L